MQYSELLLPASIRNILRRSRIGARYSWESAVSGSDLRGKRILAVEKREIERERVRFVSTNCPQRAFELFNAQAPRPLGRISFERGQRLREKRYCSAAVWYVRAPPLPRFRVLARARALFCQSREGDPTAVRARSHGTSARAHAGGEKRALGTRGLDYVPCHILRGLLLPSASCAVYSFIALFSNARFLHTRRSTVCSSPCTIPFSPWYWKFIVFWWAVISLSVPRLYCLRT